MYLMILAVALSALKYFEIGPFVKLEWTWILAVYALTAAWWAWADWSGYTKRAAVRKMDKRKAERIDRQREQLGLGTKRSKR
jgi:small Trp-rich protein